jgi:hypothetical protein
MKHAGSSRATRNTPPAESATRRRTGRKSLFVRIIEALHYSRELDATRLHRRHRHLLASHSQAKPAIAVTNFNQEEGNKDAHRDNPSVRATGTLERV